MKNITSTRIYKHIQLVIIVGLVTGIALSHVDIKAFIPSTEAIVYVKPESKDTSCDINCEIEQRTHRIFEENKDKYMEQARLDALVEMKDYLLSQIDNSPYVDYQAMSEKYGY